jgi:hypothetical protein
MEPMDADDWLKSVEKKLRVVQCSDREKVLLASHQLSGPAAHEEPESINWPEFRATFRTHHVPQGLGPGVRLPGGWVKPYPLTRVGLGNARETLNSFYKFKPFQYKFKFKLRTTSIHKIKYKSTSSHNKIWSGMNATNIIIYLNGSILEFYSFVKIRVLQTYPP